MDISNFLVCLLYDRVWESIIIVQLWAVNAKTYWYDDCEKISDHDWFYSQLIYRSSISIRRARVRHILSGEQEIHDAIPVNITKI